MRRQGRKQATGHWRQAMMEKMYAISKTQALKKHMVQNYNICNLGTRNKGKKI
jgi:hypothetical protein